MTDKEHRFMGLTADLTELGLEIIGDGSPREQDVREFVAKIHDLQRMVLAQEAARQHPLRYRLLGEEIMK